VVLKNLLSFGRAAMLANALNEAVPVEVVANVVNVGQAHRLFAVSTVFGAVVHSVS